MSPDKFQEIHHQKEVSYTEFRHAWAAFAHDLEIVGEQNRLKPRSPFEKPLDNFDSHGHHNYHLTHWEGSEKQLKAHLSKIKVVVVGCMDWRFAKALYEDVINRGFKEEEIMFISVAGGMVQYGEGREKGLETILDYVLDNSPQVNTIIATGHADRCGAVASWTDTPAGEIHEKIGPQPGSSEETQNMERLIIQGIRNHLSLPPKNSIKVFPELLKLHQPVDPDRKEVLVDIIDLDTNSTGLTVFDILNN